MGFSGGQNQSSIFHTFVHELYYFLGADISFTPITYDMAGAWNTGDDFYSNDIFIKASGVSREKSWPVNQLNLYTVKLPYLLCFEMYPGFQKNVTQCSESLCAIGQKLLGETITQVHITNGKQVDTETAKTLMKVICNG